MTRALPLLLLLTACAASEEHQPAPVYNAMLEQHDTSAGAHMVGQGEDLSTIARNYNLTIDDILRANNLASASQVGSGQRLLLPSDNLVKASTAVYAPVGPNDPNAAYIARAYDTNTNDNDNNAAPFTNGLDDMASGSMNAAPSAPVEKESLSPISSQPLTDMASNNVTPAAPTPSSVPAAAPAEPVRMASSIPPEQWTTPLNGGLRWPVKGPTLSSYGSKAGGLRNDGINIGATEGTPVEAAADGEVVYNGNAVEGFGNLVLIKHKDGFVTAYGHMSRVDVTKGQTVRAGDIIGGVGRTGTVDAPQLHFQVRKAGSVVDPSQYLTNGSGMNAQTAGL